MTIILYGTKGVEKMKFQKAFKCGTDLQDYLKQQGDAITVIRLVDPDPKPPRDPLEYPDDDY